MQATEQFTQRARRVLALANDEALRLGHDAIDTEHILLGIVREGTGVGALVLRARGIDLNRTREQVARVIRIMRVDASPTRLPTTPAVRLILDYARDEAVRLHQDKVGTEHLLLGLLRDFNGIAAQVLHELGVDLLAARAEVAARHAGGQADADVSGDSNAQYSPLFDTIAASTTRVSQRMQILLEDAQGEARRLGHQQVESEHILLPLLRDPECEATRILVRLNVNVDRLREDAEHGSRLQPLAPPPEGPLPYATLARRVVRAACDEAYSLNHHVVDSEHFLLGILHEPAGLAAELLTKAAVRIVDIRADVTRTRERARLAAGGALHEADEADEPAAAAAAPLVSTDFTDRLLATMRQARDEARAAGRFQVDTPDLIMTMLTQPDGLGIRFYRRFMDNLRGTLRDLMK